MADLFLTAFSFGPSFQGGVSKRQRYVLGELCDRDNKIGCIDFGPLDHNYNTLLDVLRLILQVVGLSKGLEPNDKNGLSALYKLKAALEAERNRLLRARKDDLQQQIQNESITMVQREKGCEYDDDKAYEDFPWNDKRFLHQNIDFIDEAREFCDKCIKDQDIV